MEFTEEQKILLSTVHRAVEEHIAPVAAETDREGRFNWDVVDLFWDLGPVSYTHLTLPTN